jgi:hypothetical protein
MVFLYLKGLVIIKCGFFYLALWIYCVFSICGDYICRSIQVLNSKLPEAQTFTDENFPEWNIDSMTIGQIRQVIDKMYVSYRVMCMKGKRNLHNHYLFPSRIVC